MPHQDSKFAIFLLLVFLSVFIISSLFYLSCITFCYFVFPFCFSLLFRSPKPINVSTTTTSSILWMIGPSLTKLISNFSYFSQIWIMHTLFLDNLWAMNRLKFVDTLVSLRGLFNKNMSINSNWLILVTGYVSHFSKFMYSSICY